MSGVQPVRFDNGLVNLDAEGGNEGGGCCCSCCCCCCNCSECVFFADCNNVFLNGVDVTLLVAGVLVTAEEVGLFSFDSLKESSLAGDERRNSCDIGGKGN